MLYPASSEGLNNILIGGPDNHRVGIGFRAKYGSPLAAVRFYTININPPNHPGYAGGNGGLYKYELYNDSNGVPSSLVSSSYHVSGGPPGTNPAPKVPVVTAPVVVPSAAQKVQLLQDNNGVPGEVFFTGWQITGAGAPSTTPPPVSTIPTALATGVLIDDKEYTEFINLGAFPLIGFPSFPLLTAGLWYHFVVTNIDKDPKTNYISLDALIGKNNINPDADSFIEYNSNGGPWTKYPSMMASPFGAFYATGDYQGNGGYQLASDGSTQCGKSYGFGKLC